MIASIESRKEFMNTILDTISGIVALLAALGVVVEVTPVKINPISWLGTLVNKDINKKIDVLQKEFDDMKYKNDMKDLADLRNRLISYGLLMQKGEELSCDVIRSVQHDLDMYDYYKETYKYMEINGRKVKINGEVEATRYLINERLKQCNTKERNE